MDDESHKNLEKRFNGKPIREILNVRNVLQPIWVRCSPILSYFSNREYLIRQFNFVLNLGILFWTILLISKTL
jgi:hypothetical protein